MPIEIGYKLSSEEHKPNDLVRYAHRAESAGFSFALISDHFHPWTSQQGQSPFVWSVIGAIAGATERLVVGTGVTRPTTRIDPAIVAHAAATSAAMMPGRFFLGLGTGEALNEHIVAQRWPEVEIRQERLAEAVKVIRLLLQGGMKSHHGKYYDVENARLYTLPDEPIPLYIAAAGKKSARLAAQLGDGLIGTKPDQEMFAAFDAEGGKDKPRYGEITVCWAKDEPTAKKIMREHWALAGLPGPLMQELPLPAHFEAAMQIVPEGMLAELVTCGSDPEAHVHAIQKYVDAGYDHVCVHQIGPDQEGFFRFYEKMVIPKLDVERPAHAEARH